jgi:hypothetical protein
MRNLCLLAFALSMILVTLAGCTAEDKRKWAEAMKDARGDNMEMRSQSHIEP